MYKHGFRKKNKKNSLDHLGAIKKKLDHLPWIRSWMSQDGLLLNVDDRVGWLGQTMILLIGLSIDWTKSETNRGYSLSKL